MGASMAMDASMYDTHSLAQASLHSLASPMLKTAATAAARAALAFGSEAIRILVIGAATGSNDVAAINMHVVPAMREAAPALPVSAVFTDVPSNDWNVLVLELAKLEGVSVSSASIGFLDAKIVLDQSIHLVLCFSALHWQSKLPWGTDTSELNEAISYLALPPRPKAQIVASADAQLARFFKHRMAELVPGGQVRATGCHLPARRFVFELLPASLAADCGGNGRREQRERCPPVCPDLPTASQSARVDD